MTPEELVKTKEGRDAAVSHARELYASATDKQKVILKPYLDGLLEATEKLATSELITYSISKAVCCSVEYTIQLPAGLSDEEIQKAAEESEVPPFTYFHYEEDIVDAAVYWTEKGTDNWCCVP